MRADEEFAALRACGRDGACCLPDRSPYLRLGLRLRLPVRGMNENRNDRRPRHPPDRRRHHSLPSRLRAVLEASS